ncbi:MAG: phosphoadenylyl-sulfate reductase [Prolixibacteraceae bacterium]|nr:phosphoadenylyl-sulfate reductase [Prolixibacteraceae bacterium]MBN2773027.1 phosphoadenylyl-sulfate reductase [Prolixibacteraceae bacterium]
MVNEQTVKLLNSEYANCSTDIILQTLSRQYNNASVFTTSFGYEDQVITDMIFRNNIPITVVTLDTGRMFEETYKVFARTLEKYKQEIKVYFPDKSTVENLLNTKGPISFYESLENRKECCHIRKVEPLGRALKGHECWITGLRASQSENRSNLNLFEWDPGFKIIKCNPLLNWSLDDVKKYINEYNVPYNALHDRGFVSIGCEPCTRAIKSGEDFRAGRWWWEQSSGKECGLHTHGK